jgi:hypothetical protein
MQQQQRQGEAFPLPHPSQAPHNQQPTQPQIQPFSVSSFLRPLTDMNSKSQHHARTDRCTGIMKKKKIFTPHPGPLIFTALAARHTLGVYMEEYSSVQFSSSPSMEP